MSKSSELIKEINNQVQRPMQTRYFGNNWREKTGKELDNWTLINIAWTQGRRAILLERALIKLIDKNKI